MMIARCTHRIGRIGRDAVILTWVAPPGRVRDYRVSRMIAMTAVSANIAQPAIAAQNTG